MVVITATGRFSVPVMWASSGIYDVYIVDSDLLYCQHYSRGLNNMWCRLHYNLEIRIDAALARMHTDDC